MQWSLWCNTLRYCTLRLIFQPAHAVYPVSCGIPFLGFRLYADHRRLSGWIAHAEHGDTWGCCG